MDSAILAEEKNVKEDIKGHSSCGVASCMQTYGCLQSKNGYIHMQSGLNEN